MDKKEIVQDSLKETGNDVFKALELASEQIYNLKVQEIASILHIHAHNFKETIIHGLAIVEKENVQNKKEFLLDVLMVVFRDQTVDWVMLGGMIDVVVYASKGYININKSKPPRWCCFTARASQ
jgi:hypothetical protein